ncbi:MAG TPA: AAA family ATPase [Candidatus Udaeobacter sp.]|nr:AAA family ATPase [Candidatus Udaeobacter sp.]
MQNTKIILGFVGLPASGKGASAEYYQKKYGASTYRFSTMLFDLLQRIYLEANRDNLIKMSEAIRSTFGEDTMAKVMAKDAETDENKLIVVEGIRRMADIEYLSRLPNFVLIEIFAQPRTRYERIVKRSEKSDDKTKTFEQFMEDHKRSTEMSIPEVAGHATEHIDNNGTPEQLYKQLDDLINKYHAS